MSRTRTRSVDMVSDRRCSTPTAAAEAIALSTDELSSKLSNARDALHRSIDTYMQGHRARLETLARSSALARRALPYAGSYFQTLDAMEERLLRAIPDALSADAHVLELLKGRLIGVGPRLCEGFGAEGSRCLRQSSTRRLAAQDPEPRIFHHVCRRWPLRHRQRRACHRR